tara:strand:+ start:11127 stop:11624 length:498 start_codon:yes stop_codon:yes gene_type:complete
MRILFFVSVISISSFCLAQDVTNKKQVNNLFSIAAGGTPTTAGVTYERILNNRKTSLEIGVGLLGGGLGINFYQFKPFNPKQINSFLGVRSSFNIQGSGGSRIMNYLLIGVNYLSSKKLYLSIDFGPAFIVQLSHNGYPNPNKLLPDYPKYILGVYGGIKFGFGF